MYSMSSLALLPHVLFTFTSLEEDQCSLQEDVHYLQEQHDVLTRKLDDLISELRANYSMFHVRVFRSIYVHTQYVHKCI